MDRVKDIYGYQDFVRKAVEVCPPKKPTGKIHLHAFLQSTRQHLDPPGNWVIASAKWQWRVSSRRSPICKLPNRCRIVYLGDTGLIITMLKQIEDTTISKAQVISEALGE